MSAWFLIIVGILGGTPQAAVIDILATEAECKSNIAKVEVNPKVQALNISCVKVVPNKGTPI